MLADAELVLDSDAKTALIAARLAALGYSDARVSGEVLPYALHHGVIGGESAVRELPARATAKTRASWLACRSATARPAASHGAA